MSGQVELEINKLINDDSFLQLIEDKDWEEVDNRLRVYRGDLYNNIRTTLLTILWSSDIDTSDWQDTIEHSMFAGAPYIDSLNLKPLKISNNIKYIEDYAFSYSTYSSIILPSNLMKIGTAAFYGCVNLVNVYLPEGIKTVYTLAFTRCDSLRYVYIPKTLHYLGDDVFHDCFNLKHIKYAGTIDEFKKLLGPNQLIRKFGQDQCITVECSDGVMSIMDD